MSTIKRLVAAALLVAGVGSALAQQAYPNRLITIIVPISLGTGADILARVFGAKLAERWGVSVIVENKPGAGSIIGIKLAAQAAGDGYSLLMAPTSFAVQPILVKAAGYDVFKSFAPVCLIATGALAFAVSDNTPARTIKEFAALAKAQPGKLNYASPGNGSPQHLAMELFKLDAGIDALHVPYKDTASAIRELASGHVNAMIVPVYTIAPLVQPGRVRVLATLGSERSPVFPNSPTLEEEGFPNVDGLVWVGLMAPASTPPEIVAKLNGEVNAILGLSDVKDLLGKQGLIPVGGKPERLADLVKSDFARWTRAIAAANIKAD